MKSKDQALLEEAYKSINESPEQNFSYYSGPAEDIIFLDDMEDASAFEGKVRKGSSYKPVYIAHKVDAVQNDYPERSGIEFYVFYTPQDFAHPALIPG